MDNPTPIFDVAKICRQHDPKFDPAKATLEDIQAAFDDVVSHTEGYKPPGAGRDVFIALPQYKNTNPLTLFSLLALFDRSKMRLKMNFGDALIAHTRNKLAKAFLDSGCEWSLWVDDDMVLPIGDAAWFNSVTDLGLPSQLAEQHTLNRLLSHGKTIVGGLYFGRSSRGKPMFYEGANDANIAMRLRSVENLGRLVPSKWVGTGCVLIHRKVFLDIVEKFPHLAPRKGSPDDFAFFTPHPDRVFFILAQAAEEKDPAAKAKLVADAAKAASEYRPGIGEDVTFCGRALYCGHQPHVDTGLVCGHVGNHAYGPTNTNPRPTN